MTKLSDFELNRFIPYLMFLTSLRLRGYFEEKVLSEYNLTIEDWRILAHLYFYDRQSIRDMYQQVKLTKVEVSRLALKLMERGFVCKGGNLEDHRLIVLRLTGDAKKIVEPLMEILLQHEEKYLEKLTSNERQLLYDVLFKINKNIHEL